MTIFRVLGVGPKQASEGKDGNGMDASSELQDDGRDAARPRSAPAFCQPQPVPPRPYRPPPLEQTASPPRRLPPETVAVLPRPAAVVEPIRRETEAYDSRPEVPLRDAYGAPSATKSLYGTNAALSGIRESSIPTPPPVRTLWGDESNAAEADLRSAENAETVDEVPVPQLWTALARGVALLLGTLLILDLFGPGGLPTAGPWWLDTRPLPVTAAAGLLGLSAAFLVVFAIRGTLPAVLRGTAMLCMGLLIAVALKNATIYYGLLQRGDLHAGPPVAFSLHVIGCVAVVLIAMRSKRAVTGLGGTFLVLVGFNAALISFPVAQIACSGSIDSRKPATAAIVLGPRPFEVGGETRLTARVERAAELHHSGLAPRLVLTGAGDDQLEAMKSVAIEQGVSESAIELLNELEVVPALKRLRSHFPHENKREPTLLIVSDVDHLPRVGIEARRIGLRTAPVPAASSSPVSREVLLHEIVALWRSYARR